MADMDIAAVVDAVSVAEDVNVEGFTLPVIVYDGISIAEAVTMSKETTVIAGKSYSGIVLETVDNDWAWTDNYPGHQQGRPLIALVVIPGGTDVFSIKDGSDAGPYIYYKSISAAETILYGGIRLRPYIDFSECTLNTGHKISFLWGLESR